MCLFSCHVIYHQSYRPVAPAPVPYPYFCYKTVNCGIREIGLLQLLMMTVQFLVKQSIWFHYISIQFNSIKKKFIVSLSTNEYWTLIQVHNHKHDSGFPSWYFQVVFYRRLKTCWLRRHRNQEINSGDISRGVVWPTGLSHAKLVSLTSPCCSGWPAPMNTQGQQRTAEQRWVRWLQCLTSRGLMQGINMEKSSQGCYKAVQICFCDSYHNKIIDIQNRLPYSKVVYPATIVLFSCLMEVNHGPGSRPNYPFS